MFMFKLSNGIIDEEEIAAVLKIGPNHEIIFKSGQRHTIAPAEAIALMQELDPSPAGVAKKS